MKEYKIGLTKDAAKLFELLNREQKEQIFDIVISAPAGKFKVDSSDGFVTLYGTPMSFLRDHECAEITIMTTAEAKALDAHHAKK